jgi:hypothetical protein
VFVHDRQLGTTERASVTSSGQETHGSDDFGLTAWSALSPDGRYVVFESTAHDVVPGDTNGTSDVFLRDRQLGTTERVSLGSAGQQGDFQSSWPGISADGRYVVFLSRATNLVPGDTNAKIDVFVRDGPISFSTFCSGDDTGTACPCGNAGVAGQGCASSAAPQGARLTATGGPSIGDDTLVLAGSSMPNAAALYFQGTTRQNGGLGVVFGDGLRCAGGTIHRLATKLNAGGASQFPGAGDASVSARGIVTAVGTRTYQVWYRNAAAFCTSSTFNLSNGLEIVWSF